MLAASLVTVVSTHAEILESLDGIVDRIPEVMDPAGIAMYGGGGLVGVVVVRRLLGRLRGRTQHPAPTMAATTSTEVGGVGKHKVAVTLPSFLQMSRGIREVTHNEVRAMQLGVVVGFVTTWLYSIGRTEPAVIIVIAFVVGSLGFKRYSSTAVKTVRMEPWYGLTRVTGGGSRRVRILPWRGGAVSRPLRGRWDTSSNNDVQPLAGASVRIQRRHGLERTRIPGANENDRGKSK